MINKLHEMWKDESGATTIEYGLIVGGISIVLLAGVVMFGDQFATMMESFSTYLDSVQV